MAEQMRPTSNEQAPDPAVSYERADPKRESGGGRVTTNTNATPTPSPDKMPTSVPHAQTSHVQVNSQESATAPQQPDHSMLDEEPLGWDQAPTGKTEQSNKRHPKTEGKGGTE